MPGSPKKFSNERTNIFLINKLIVSVLWVGGVNLFFVFRQDHAPTKIIHMQNWRN
jgi:hypothetical protein